MNKYVYVYLGCEDDEREVVIIYEDSDDRGPDISKLARQLYTQNSIVRSLKYKSTILPQGIPFEHRLLRVKDKEINPFQLLDRDYECEYKVLANEFLNTLRFSKHGKRGIIFIQSSLESEEIAKLMFTNITKPPDFAIYRASEEPAPVLKRREFPYVTDVPFKNWRIMSSLAARYLPDLCTGTITDQTIRFNYTCIIELM